VDQTALTAALAGVVEDVVNRVGVEVNTASPALLGYVSGIGPKLAEKIVAVRNEQGLFADRESLRNVPGLGPKAFEQSAGFLRIRGGVNPLDASAIHPESYPVATAVLEVAGVSADAPFEDRQSAIDRLCKQPVEELAEEIGCGVPTLSDILEQLVRPGAIPAGCPGADPALGRLKMEDLSVGMKLKGTVRNVVDFASL
jgi:uncharacterized protein